MKGVRELDFGRLLPLEDAGGHEVELETPAPAMTAAAAAAGGAEDVRGAERDRGAMQRPDRISATLNREKIYRFADFKKWENIPNLSIITGRNGSGKSALLDLIKLKEKELLNERHSSVHYFGQSSKPTALSFSKDELLEAQIVLQYLMDVYCESIDEPDAKLIPSLGETIIVQIKHGIEKIRTALEDEASPLRASIKKLRDYLIRLKEGENAELWQIVEEALNLNTNDLTRLNLLRESLKIRDEEDKQSIKRRSNFKAELKAFLNGIDLNEEEVDSFIDSYLSVRDEYKKLSSAVDEGSLTPLEKLIGTAVRDSLQYWNLARSNGAMEDQTCLVPLEIEILYRALEKLVVNAKKKLPEPAIEVFQMNLIYNEIASILLRKFVSEYFFNDRLKLDLLPQKKLEIFLDHVYVRSQKRDEFRNHIVEKILSRCNGAINVDQLFEYIRPYKHIANYIERLNNLYEEFGIQDLYFCGVDRDNKQLYFSKGSIPRIFISDLSSGEIDFLSLIAFLVTIENKIEIGYSDILLLMDEPDKHFDPDLCKMFWEILNKRFLEKEVQVIVTTHRTDTISLVPENIDSSLFVDWKESPPKAAKDASKARKGGSSAASAAAAGGAGGPRGGPIGPVAEDAVALGASKHDELASGSFPHSSDGIRSGFFYIDQESKSLVKITRLHALFKLTRNLREITHISSVVYAESHFDAKFYEGIYTCLRNIHNYIRTQPLLTIDVSGGLGPYKSRLHSKALYEYYMDSDSRLRNSRLLSNRYQLEFQSSSPDENGGDGGVKAVEKMVKAHRDYQTIRKLDDISRVNGFYLRRQMIEAFLPMALIDKDYSSGANKVSAVVMKRHSVENVLIDPFLIASLNMDEEICKVKFCESPRLRDEFRNVLDIIKRRPFELEGTSIFQNDFDKKLQNAINIYFVILLSKFYDRYDPLEDIYDKDKGNYYWEVSVGVDYEGMKVIPKDVKTRVKITDEMIKLLVSSYPFEGSIWSKLSPSGNLTLNIDSKEYVLLPSNEEHVQRLYKEVKFNLLKQQQILDLRPEGFSAFSDDISDSEAIYSRSLDILYGGDKGITVGVLLGDTRVIKVTYPQIVFDIRGHNIGDKLLKTKNDNKTIKNAYLTRIFEQTERNVTGMNIMIPLDLCEVFHELNEQIRNKANRIVKPWAHRETHASSRADEREA